MDRNIPNNPIQKKSWKRPLMVIAIAFLGGININPGADRNFSFPRAWAETAEISPAVFRVVKASLQATPSEYNGPCPVEIKFKAKISVSGGKGEVVFNIVKSDNVPAPVVTMFFDKPGVKDTVYSWHSKDNFLGWHQLEIVKPNQLKSNQVEVAVMCQ